MSGGWRRLGRLGLDISRAASWASTHAALPVTERIDDRCWNVYLALRDDGGRARIGRTTLVLDPVPALAPLEADPILDLGPLGAFDDSGVVPSCLVQSGARRFLYYTGWSRGVTVPFYLFAGVATSDAAGSFERVSPGPLLDRDAVDPFLNASPYVLREHDTWRMWYVSGSGWIETADGPRHYYNIRYAASGDGLHWNRAGHICVDYASDEEYAFGRPWVMHDRDRYRMWYSVRGDRYRIGYADSVDGREWVRRDHEAGLLPAASGWDGEMTTYPSIFDHAQKRYMLYNGNDYGRTGVGLAVWEPVR